MDISLKIIAKNEGVNYGYARTSYAKYKRKLVTNKDQPIPPLDSPFPFQVHNLGMFGEGSTRWYKECPVEPSTTNRNAQKTYGTPHYSITFHKGGKYQIYRYTVDWKKELKKWLSEWMDYEDRNVFFDYLIDSGGKHYCASTPGVPLGFKINVPGIARFETDKTPFPNGTTEMIMDAGFERRLNRIEGIIAKRLELDERRIKSDERQLELNERQIKTTEIFAVAMEEHMTLIKELQDVSRNQQQVSKDFNNALNKMSTDFNKAINGFMELASKILEKLG